MSARYPPSEQLETIVCSLLDLATAAEFWGCSEEYLYRIRQSACDLTFHAPWPMTYCRSLLPESGQWPKPEEVT